MFCGSVFSSSQTFAETVTGPNGEPPLGGSKTPLTVNVRVLPLTNVTAIGEPTLRS